HPVAAAHPVAAEYVKHQGGKPRVDAAPLDVGAFSYEGGRADSDTDGLADEWEMLHFGNLSQGADGNPDGDDFSNLAEYFQGTDPTTAEAALPYLTRIDWEPVGLGGGGAQYSPAIAPNDPGLMYGICDMGGFYRSLNGGRQWEMYHGSVLERPVAYSPNAFNPKFDPFNENVSFLGSRSGLKRTLDGGNTWELMSTDRPQGFAIKRSNTQVMVYGNTDNRLYKSTNRGNSWTELSGWRSSVNKIARDLFIDPASADNNLTIYACTSSGVHKSADNGATWTAINTGLPSTDTRDFDGGMKGSSVVLYVTVHGNGVYKSTNGGANWVAKNSGFNVGAAGRMELGVCEGNADILYVGSQENGGPTVYKSTNGADNWSLVLIDPASGKLPGGINVERDWMTLAYGWAWGEEPHEIMVSPSDGNRVAFAEDGRTWRSSDGGQSWFCCNARETGNTTNWWTSAGFEVTTNYFLHWSPWGHNRTYITYTDIGFARSEDYGYSWRWSATGSPWRNTFYDITFDPDVPGKMWACASNHHDIPHEKMLRRSNFPEFSGGVLLSTNYGASWTDLGHSNGLPIGAPTSIVLDPASSVGSRTLYAAIIGKGVYKSTDGGANWFGVNTGLAVGPNKNVHLLKLMADGTLYCSITMASSPTHDYKPGGMFKSTNGGASWTMLNSGQALPYICGFDVDAVDQNRIYVGTMNMAYSGGGLWKTVNGGATWQRTLDLDDTYSASIDPEVRSRVYAPLNRGEDYYPTGGIYLSEDYGANWSKLGGYPFENYGPNYVCFDPDDSQNIWVTTFGGGVWRSRVRHFVQPSAAFTASAVSGEAPLAVSFDSGDSTGDVTLYTWDFGDGGFSRAANPLHVFESAGNYTVTFTIECPTGTATASAVIEVQAQGSTDTDGDGLPDTWEIDNFGDLDEGPGGDFDGDGATNGEEFEEGTDPTQADTSGPVTSSVNTVPTNVRQGEDDYITLLAVTDDSANGNSNIVRAEYFVGSDPGVGHGKTVSVADGTFDSPAEALTATVDVRTWTGGSYRIYVRAKDAAGHWGAAASVLVPVVDGVAPGAVRNLTTHPALSFDRFPRGFSRPILRYWQAPTGPTGS
ncbi:MAG: PKD domain-containing protein, partial [Planctomycetota bacterium]